MLCKEDSNMIADETTSRNATVYPSDAPSFEKFRAENIVIHLIFSYIQ